MIKRTAIVVSGLISLLAAACAHPSATAPAASPDQRATTTAAVVIRTPDITPTAPPAPTTAPALDDDQPPPVRMGLTHSVTLGASTYHGPPPEGAASGPAPADPGFDPGWRVYPRTYARTYVSPRLRAPAPTTTVAQPHPTHGTPAVGGNWPAPRSFGPAMLTH